MFNPANLATEIFGILRSFDYVVNIFDFDGNRVYEPSEARRFFASPKNITVSIHEDGENSGIKMFLSASTDISEVSGLISTMRVTASKFGLLFNVRKYERELKPKDLAPNAAANYDAGVSLADAAEDNDGAEGAKEIEFGDHEAAKPENVDKAAEPKKLNAIDAELVKLKDSLPGVAKALRAKKNMKENMEKNIEPLNEADAPVVPNGPTVHLKAFDMDVDAAAWKGFLAGKLAMTQPPMLNITDEDIDAFKRQYVEKTGMGIDDPTAETLAKLTNIATVVSDQSFKAVLLKCIDLYATGAPSTIVTNIIDKVLTVAGDTESERNSTDDSGNKIDNSTIKVMGINVEASAWEEFKANKIAFSAPVNFNAVKLGPSANKMAIYLNMVASATKAHGLANFFSALADVIDSGNPNDNQKKVALKAINIAKSGGVNESAIIVTESIAAFGKWFDSMSTRSIFESSYGSYGHDDGFPDDRHDRAFDIAYNTVKDNFSVDAFLAQNGSDFNYGDHTLVDEDKHIDYDYIKASLVHYLDTELEAVLDGMEFPSRTQVSDLAYDLMKDVVAQLSAEGWTITDVPADANLSEGMKLLGTHKSEDGKNVAKVYKNSEWNTHTVKLYKDGKHYEPADYDSDDLDDAHGTAKKMIEECACEERELDETELSTEDVILPKNAANDLTHEVESDDDHDVDIARMVQLSRGAKSTTPPRLPNVQF